MSPLSLRIITHFRGKETEVREVSYLSQVELCALEIHMLKSWSPGPQNVTLLGNKVIVGVISEDEVILE